MYIIQWVLMNWTQWDHALCFIFFLWEALGKHFWWLLMTSHDLTSVKWANLLLESLGWSWLMSSTIEVAITTSICQKWASWFPPPPVTYIMESSRNWPDLRSWIYKIRDIQVVGSYRLIIFCNFQSARSSTLALTRSQSCKMVMWGRFI